MRHLLEEAAERLFEKESQHHMILLPSGTISVKKVGSKTERNEEGSPSTTHTYHIHDRNGNKIGELTDSMAVETGFRSVSGHIHGKPIPDLDGYKDGGAGAPGALQHFLQNTKTGKKFHDRIEEHLAKNKKP
jgi:hypothetical protein